MFHPWGVHAPHFILNLMPLSPETIVSLGGFASNLLGGATGNMSPEFALRNNKKLMEAQQRLQIEEFNRQWDNMYSPKAQVKNATDAGINPFVNAQAQTTLSAQPSAGMPSMPESSYHTLGMTNFKMLSDSISQIANTAKTFKEVGWYDNKMRAEVDKLLSDKKFTDVRARHEAILSELDRKYGAKLRNSEIKKNVSSFVSNMANADLALASGEYQRANTVLVQLEQDLKQIEKQASVMKLDMLGFDLKYYEKSLKARIRAENAAASSNEASARLTNFEADIKEVEANIAKNPEVAKAKFASVLSSLEKDTSLNEKQKQEVRALQGVLDKLERSSGGDYNLMEYVIAMLRAVLSGSGLSAGINVGLSNK